jgi:putative PIN family toxin of toxin-antitoxin system
VVLDANILVSALLTPLGPPGRVLELALVGEVVMYYDSRIMAEYREVLGRPKYPFSSAQIAALLDQLQAVGVPTIGAPSVRLPDPDDAPFAEVAEQAQAWLVTGNLRHYPGLRCAIGPASFLAAEQTRAAAPPEAHGRPQMVPPPGITHTRGAGQSSP